MEHKKELWAVLLVVVGVTAFLVYTAASVIGQIIVFKDSTPSVGQLVDMSGWQTYHNDTYGFSVSYPQDWQISTDNLSANVPFVAIGNPLNGTTTYSMEISAQSNSSSLSSGEYVHDFLDVAQAQDASNTANGPAPMIAPKFSKSLILTEGGQEAYELFYVFEFDHSAEQIYVANGNIVLVFDFPVAENNPNIASPTRNNAIAHEIVNSLTFTN